MQEPAEADQGVALQLVEAALHTHKSMTRLILVDKALILFMGFEAAACTTHHNAMQTGLHEHDM